MTETDHAAGPATAQEELLGNLDRAAVALLSGKRIDSVEPPPVALAGADFSGHAWAELVVAAALAQEHRDDEAETLLGDAERQFEAGGQRRGLGWLAYVQATIALGRGRLDRVAAHLGEVNELLAGDADFPADSLAHLGLVAFYGGDPRQAILLAESALTLARSTGNRRHEGVALVYLGYFEFWRGRFTRVERLVDAAEDVYAGMEDPNDAFELPLVLALRAALHAVRGLVDAAEEQYAAALEAADELNIEWYEAIVLALRAQFLASAQPHRSRDDAARSLELLVEMGDEWWQVWAQRALGVAHTALGDHAAAERALTEALARSPGPQERALTLIALGTAQLETGDPRRAAATLKRSIESAQEVDVGYLVAWAASLLARAEPDRAGDWRRLVHEHDDGDRAYEQLLATDLRITLLDDAGVWRGPTRVRFATRHAETALYCLALADDHTIHDEVLAERLWPDAPADRISGRLATVAWQIRRGLGPDRWRVQRHHELVRLDGRGLDIDVTTLRRAAAELLTAPAVNMPAARRTVAALLRPLLPDLRSEEWVQHGADQLAEITAQIAARLGPDQPFDPNLSPAK